MTASAPAGLHSAPTESHSLATADHEEKGTAQEDHDESEVKDLGWNQHVDQVPAPLVGGLPNEEVWTLVRRFNKQMYHVKATPTAPPGGLDLNIAEDEEFSPDKLRSNIERLYMTVIVGMAAFVKHIARLRSWNETRRTASFCTVYYLAWFFDIIGPVFLSTMLVLIVYPPSRKILFPPAPLALVDASTGGMKKPTAGMLGSHDSMTGAPEKHQGEAVEQEAHNFVTGLTSIGLSSATGKHPEDTAHKDGVVEDTVPDPTNLATGAANARESAKGGDPTTTHDKSKQPMEVAMWQKARPVMHILANIADTWERFANALSPTPPFPRDAARLRLGAILGSAIPVAFMTTSAVAVKATGFIMGAVFFGDPITSRGLKLLNEKVPHWERFLDIRNTLLLGVPTNAQLTVTLLRIGEANRAPLPPPPQSDAPPSSRPPSLHGDDVPMDVSHEEVQDAIHPEAPTPSSTSPTGSDKKGGKKVTAGTRILGFFKRTTRIGVTTTLGADRFKAAAGSGHARNRLGVLPKPNEDPFSGPVDFKARYQGKRGSIYLSTAGSDTPCLTFTREGESAPPPPSTTAATDATAADTKKAAPRIPLTSITSIKKLNGLGWKVKLVVGWAMTDREVADGIEIEDGQGNSWVFTAMQKRDELFNRLVAVGGQIWIK
ncbi:MAG: hypothetical protein M1838_003206 [Thelocarpon superellum]|nr:MAG: hypothetical protein M1838_003206 [Thelocarpon superellum]